MQNNEAIIGVYIDNCCGYRVFTGWVLLRLQRTNYGGLYEYRYDYKITIDIKFQVTRITYKLMLELVK